MNSNEIDATISRINSYEEVDRILIIKSIETETVDQSIVIRSQTKSSGRDDGEEAQKFAKVIPKIGREARSMIRQFDPKV